MPGLLDVSPEELRYEAYKAKASGNSANYLQNLNQLGTKQMTVQRHLSSISIDDARSLVRRHKNKAFTQFSPYFVPEN